MCLATDPIDPRHGGRRKAGTASGALGIVVSQGLKLAGAGVLVGLLGAAALGRVLARLLYDVNPLDSVTLIGGSLLSLSVAALASVIPARRAPGTAPAEASQETAVSPAPENWDARKRTKCPCPSQPLTLVAFPAWPFGDLSWRKPN